MSLEVTGGKAAPKFSGGAKPQEKGGGGVSTGAAVAGGGVLAAVSALLFKNPKALNAVKTGGRQLNALRQQLMLSGWAAPKSVLGNVGSGVEDLVETGSPRVLKELFSRQTAKDIASSYKANTGLPGAGANAPRQAVLKVPGVPLPGRVMGALDEATQAAHVRAGKTATEAESAVLQAPLTGRLAGALDSPAARYAIPFRRTPFNQFMEGLERLPTGSKGSTRAKATYMGAGAAHGALTADDETPMSIPLATAFASRYGLPYAAAALAGRHYLGGGKGGANIASSMLPVSEYGITQGIEDPLKPFDVVSGKKGRGPAAFKALNDLLGVD